MSEKNEEFYFGLKAYDHICYLSKNIGGRLAGSHSIQQAQRYVKKSLEEWGYSVKFQDFKFAPLPWLYTLNIFFGLWLMISVWLIESFPIITLFMPVIFSLIPTVMRMDVKRRERTSPAKNLFCFSGDNKEKPLLVICAHLDSAPAVDTENKFLLWFSSRSLTIIQRLAFLLAFLSVFSLLDFRIPFWLNNMTRIICLIIGALYIFFDVYSQLCSKKFISPGAYDNASGVSVSLCLAEYFSKNLPARVDLCFLFTDAEETGMHGARAFVEKIKDHNRKTAFLNLDMVGAGQQLCYVSKEGGLNSRSTDEKLNELLRSVHVNAKPIRYIMRSGDFAPFLEHNIPAISLETRGNKEAQRAYHHIKDTDDVVEPAVLNMVTKTVIQFVEQLPYSRWFGF